MAGRSKDIARALGAKKIGRIPDAGGGAFGAARMPALVAALKERLKPALGQRPGRPTDAEWTQHPKVPMSEDTLSRLRELAGKVSSEDRKISPMQLAAQILEEAVANCGEN